MAETLYTVEKDCPICGKKFIVTRVRNKLSMLRQDSDFCTYYKEVNPYYYAVWVCCHCGYAAQDTYFAEVAVPAAEKIRAFLRGREVNINFGGTRTLDQAIASYKLAIFFGEMNSLLSSRLAGLYLKLAWLFREAEQLDEENLVLLKARHYYENALAKERMPIGNMSEITLEYLIAELYRRTGQLDQALAYFGRLVSNPQARSEKRILELARDAWHEVREAKKKADEAADLQPAGG